jgi:phthiocerol/phenolphthiocerol synthesis type-I polyketide synthase E
MPDLSRRIADFPPARRQLFERLLKAKDSGMSAGRTPGADADHGASLPAAPKPEKPAGPLILDLGSSPAETKSGYRRFYNTVSEQLNATEFGDCSFFLNYGYVPDHHPQYSQVQLPSHCLNKNSIKLALELIGDCEIAGQDVLDVGCGRGGTASVMCSFFGPRMIVGIDLSSAAISFCRKAHRYREASFLEADAEALPFREGSFDVVTNVESSHSYPTIEKFYAEVFRVLKPLGYFLYTDVLSTESMRACAALLEDVGFLLEREVDITSNVLLSCDETASARLGAFDPEQDREMVEGFLGVPGSAVYEEMRNKQAMYKIFKLKRL